MNRVNLGNSGISVSQLCLGTMYFGTKLTTSESANLLDHFVNHGGNFIDTSNNYAFWMDNGVGDESDLAIGQWIKNSGRRDQIILATKCGARPVSFNGNLATIKLQGLSSKTIINAVDQSLKRLNTDYIDVLYGHIDFAEYPISERLEAFNTLVKSGKVRSTGTSNTYAWRIEESNQFCRQHNLIGYCCVQQKYSYLRPKQGVDFWVQKLINEELIDYCAAHDEVSLLAYSTLLSGLYSKGISAELPDEYDTEDNGKRMKTLIRVAEEVGRTNHQVVLSWIMNHKVKIIPVISGSKPHQITESINSCDVNLSKSLFDELCQAGD